MSVVGESCSSRRVVATHGMRLRGRDASDDTLRVVIFALMSLSSSEKSYSQVAAARKRPRPPALSSASLPSAMWSTRASTRARNE